jgi:Bacteriocin-protection, YdeI or OmpD-Associated/Domain of unknown function (DUF1905)
MTEQRTALFTHEFEAPLSAHGVGRSRVIWYQVLFMPERLARELPFKEHPRLRVRGEIADIPVTGAWMPAGDGRHYFIVSPAVRKGTGARLGDLLEMRFFVDDQARVDVPAALAEALAAKPRLLSAWQALTPGKRRGLAHRVAQARSSATEQRRVQEVMAVLAAGH